MRSNEKKKEECEMKKMLPWNMTFLLVLCAGIFITLPLAAEGAMTLKLNHVFVPGAPADRAAELFAQNVNKRSQGELQVQIFKSAQLGDVLGTYQGLTLGTIDFTVVDASLGGYIKGHEELFVGQVPYLYDSLEDAARIYNSEIYVPLTERLRKEKGIRTMAVAGFKQGRCINTIKGPIFSPADCKDIKIRVMPCPISIKTFAAWGFKPTPVNWNELYMALKQGIVEGQDNGPDLTCPEKFYEVAKYYAFSNHVYCMFGWYASEKTWPKIPDKFKPILIEEAKRAGDSLTASSNRQFHECIDIMAKAGVKITVPNRFAFAEAAKDVWKEFDGKMWPEGMVQKIRDMQKK
jgi:TRAP-type transport system periplasmic protein